MRISSAKRWLALVLSLRTEGANGVTKQAVKFDNSDFQGTGADTSLSIFVLENLRSFGDPVPISRGFRWNTTNKLEIQHVSLYAIDDLTSNEILVASGSRADSDHKNSGDANTSGGLGNNPINGPIATPTTPTLVQSGRPKSIPTQASSEEVKRQAARNQGGVGLTVTSSEIGGVVNVIDLNPLLEFKGQQLYFKAIWPNEKGESYSRVFTVVGDNAEYATFAFNPAFRNESAIKPEVNKTANGFLGAEPTSPGSTTPPSDISSAGGQRSPNEGLPTGAIIGIAVACGVLGLLLIGAGVWFLLRRRRQSNNLGGRVPARPYGTEHSRTEDLMAEKEASAGPDPPPHSPYSDEGVILGGSSTNGTHHDGSSIPVGVGAAAPVLPQQIIQQPRLPQPHDQPRSYTPYSDRGSGGGAVGSPSTHAASIAHSEDAARAGMGSPTAGRATPHSSVAPQYAHLVEEGMTEDEIRRLEDEERQLDAAIEEAGRR